MMGKKLFATLLLIGIPITLLARPVVGIVGDSISVPLPIKPADGYIYLLENELDFKLVNYSIGASTTRTLLSRLQEMFKRHRPDIVIIALGINDAGHKFSTEEVFTHLFHGIEFVRTQDVPLFLGIVNISFYNWHGPTYSKDFNQIYSRLKQIYPDIELFPFMTFELIDDPSYFTIDEKVHPNPAGHRRIANEFKNLLKQKMDQIDRQREKLK